VDRIYMNKIDGQRRIHVEIHDHEVPDLLDDLDENPDHFASTRRFLGILRVAEETFSPAIAEGRRDRDARTTARQTTGQDDTDRYDARLTAPMTTEAAAALRDRIETGPLARRTVGQPAEAHGTNSSVRNVIEHALTVYYQDSSAPSAIARAILAQHRSETLREAAETVRTEAAETATAAQENYDPDMAREAKRLNVMAARLDRMAVEDER